MFSLQVAYNQLAASTRFVGVDRGSLNLDLITEEGIRR